MTFRDRMKIAFRLPLAAAAIAAAAGCASLGIGASPGADRTVRLLEHRVATAIDAGDTAVLNSLLAPEFALVMARDTTRRVERGSWIANTRAFTFDSVSVEIDSVTEMHDTVEAVLTFRFQVEGPGRPRAAETYLLRDRWSRRSGTWRLLRRTLLERQTRPF